MQVDVNIAGSGAIGDGSTGLIAALRQISADLDARQHNALQTTDLQALDAARRLVEQRRAIVGARTNRLESATLAAAAARAERTTKLLSDTEDADMAKTITDYSTQQAVYQAALKAGAQIIQPSLMDFLR